MIWFTAILGFLKEKGGPYGVAMAVLGSITYLAYVDIPEIKLAIVAAAALGLGITYFVARNTREKSTAEPAVALYVQVGNEEPVLITQEHPMAFRLSANGAVEIKGFRGRNRLGAAVAIENPILTVSDPAQLELIDTTTGRKFLRPLVSEGTAQLQITADALPGEGEVPISSVFTIEIWPGLAVAAEPDLGEEIPGDQIPTE